MVLFTVEHKNRVQTTKSIVLLILMKGLIFTYIAASFSKYFNSLFETLSIKDITSSNLYAYCYATIPKAFIIIDMILRRIISINFIGVIWCQYASSVYFRIFEKIAIIRRQLLRSLNDTCKISYGSCNYIFLFHYKKLIII